MKNKILLLLAILLVGILVGRFVFPKDPNNAPTYGDTGMPKNCRAVVQANIDGVTYHQFTAEEALGSIERNCGLHGYAWGL